MGIFLFHPNCQSYFGNDGRNKTLVLFGLVEEPACHTPKFCVHFCTSA
jgi:hypothetical protein